MTLSPQAFVAKWRGAALKESAAYQEHFTDLCRLLGHLTPAEASDEEILERLLALNLAWVMQRAVCVHRAAHADEMCARRGASDSTHST